MHVNPTGRFVTGGPMGDAGLTGRKIIVDIVRRDGPPRWRRLLGQGSDEGRPVGGLRARWVAKNVVAAGLADRFEVEVAYGIGIARPISFSVDSFGTGRIDDARSRRLIERHFDLRPASIIAALDLRRPIYRQTAPTATSAGPTSTCRGSAPTRPRSSPADAGLPEPSRSPSLRPAEPRGRRRTALSAR
jgi:S-adenosylmethionine synthetase